MVALTPWLQGWQAMPYEDIGLCDRHVQADFGVGVKITTMCDGFTAQFKCALIVIHATIPLSLLTEYTNTFVYIFLL